MSSQPTGKRKRDTPSSAPTNTPPPSEVKSEPEEPVVQVDRADLPVLNTRSVGRKVWLVKVPNFLSDAWKKQVPDTELGRVRISTKGPQTEISLALTGPAMADLPKDYKLQMSSVGIPFLAFGEDDAGGVSVEGTVKSRGELQPERFDEYRQLLRRRFEQSNTRERHVQAVDDTREVAIRAEQHPVVVRTMVVQPDDDGQMVAVATAVRTKRPKRPASPPDKNVAIDRNELVDKLFVLFEKRSKFTLKELVQVTAQPVDHLKRVLAEICIFNKRGPNKNYFELKAEYAKK